MAGEGLSSRRNALSWLIPPGYPWVRISQISTVAGIESGLAASTRSSRYALYGSSLVRRGARGPYTGAISVLRYFRTLFRESPVSRAIP